MPDFSQNIEQKLVLNAEQFVTATNTAAAAMRRAGDEAKETQAKARDLFGSQSANKLIGELDRLQKEYNDLTRAQTVLRQAQKTAFDPVAIKAYATELGKVDAGLRHLKDVARSAGIELQKTNKGLSLGKQVAGELFSAFTVAGAVAAVSSLTVGAVKLAAEYEKTKKSFEAFLGSAERAEQVVGNLNRFAAESPLDTQAVVSAGRALLSFGEDADNLVPVLERLGNVSAASGKDFNELALIYGKARTQGTLFAEDINQLTEAGIPIIQQFAAQLGVSGEEVKKLASQGKIGFAELELAIASMASAGGQAFGQLDKQAETLAGQWDLFLGKMQDSLRSFGAAIGSVLAPVLRQINEMIDTINGKDVNVEVNANVDDARRAYEEEKEARQDLEILEKRAEADRKKRLAGTAAQAEAARKKREAELAKLEALERDRARARLEVMQEGVEKELAAEALRFEEEKKALGKLFAGRKELHGILEQAERQHKDKLNEIRAVAAVEELTAAAEQRKALEDAQAADEKSELDSLERKRALALQDVAINEAYQEQIIQNLRRSGATQEEIKRVELQFDAQGKAARLDAEIQFQEALLGLTENATGERREAIVKQIELLKAQRQTLLSGVDLPDGGGERKQAEGILGLFGIELTDEEQDAFNEAADAIVEGLNRITEARVQAAEAAVRAADEEIAAREKAVESAENYLAEQLKVAELGFASDVTNAQQKLALARKEEAEARAKRARAVQEQQKAARAQLVVDSALQASNIATAATSIFKQGAAFWPVGLILAIASVASLISLVVGIKARAKAISAQQFRKGGQAAVDQHGRIVGPSHEQGGRAIEVEGREFVAVTDDGRRIAVVRKSMTEKYFPVLSALNDNEPAKAWALLSELARPRRFEGPRLDYAKAGGTVSSATLRQERETRRKDDELRELRRLNKTQGEALREARKARPHIIVNPDGSRTEITGLRRRTLR